jgi:hypothetical protein
MEEWQMGLIESKNEFSEEEMMLLADLQKEFGKEKGKEMFDSSHVYDNQYIKEYLELDKTWGDIPHSFMLLFDIDVRAKDLALGWQVYRYGKKMFLVQTKEYQCPFGFNEPQFYNFIRIHNKHLRQWGQEDLVEQYLYTNIKKLEWVEEEQCFHVHFFATKEHKEIWYHYCLDGTWY